MCVRGGEGGQVGACVHARVPFFSYMSAALIVCMCVTLFPNVGIHPPASACGSTSPDL